MCMVLAQVNELDSAVNRAAEQPQRFGLTPEEISSRRKWITATRRQVSSLCWGLGTPLCQARYGSSSSSRCRRRTRGGGCLKCLEVLCIRVSTVEERRPLTRQAAAGSNGFP